MTNKILPLIMVVLLSAFAVFSQTTEFTYQGSLTVSGSPANGNYDFEFALFDSLSVGMQVGSTLTKSAVAVSTGSFVVKLDFGNQFTGANRFLEVRVRPSGGGSFTALAPRQQVNSSPYSVKSLTADTSVNATNATNASNAVNATNATTAATATNALSLGGVVAGQYVLTGDARLSDARPPIAGSTNYVQNQNAGAQVSTDFNISGNGTAGGTLSGNTVNASTQFNIGGERILGNPGDYNLFAGGVAGLSNTTGNSNAFFGAFAGFQNTVGSNNAFFGTGAGGVNTTGSNNTMIGDSSNLTANNLSNATAIGSRAGVGASNSMVLGSISGVNGASTSTNVGIGTITPDERLHVVGNGLFTGNLTVNGTIIGNLPAGSTSYIQNSTVQQTGSNFNVSGNGTAAGTLSGNIVTAATQFNIGGSRILGKSGVNNLFAGVGAGSSNTTGSSNAFFGAAAGYSNTIGGSNAFFGTETGIFNTAGSSNAFFGAAAGKSNTTGSNNDFFGNSAGFNNTTGAGNDFFGLSAGYSNTTGQTNDFFGISAGFNNTTGSMNTFLGGAAGYSNTVGNYNTFFGEYAGYSNTTGSNNTIIGTSADLSANNLTNATAIGSNAAVGISNSLVLGSISGINDATASTNVGIGTTTPQYRLHIVGENVRVENSATFPRFSLNNTGAGVDQKRWQNYAGTTALMFSALNDAENAEIPWLQVSRGTGTAITSVKFPNGNVGIGSITNVNNKLDVNGTLGVWTLGSGGSVALCWHTVGYNLSTCGSSLRYKTNIGSFNYGMNIINRLRPITFDWKEGGLHDFGLGAEDVAAIEPLLVTYNKKGEVEGVKYDRIGVVLINAVKEQQSQIEAQDKTIKAQQNEIADLKSVVCSIRPRAKVCRNK